MKQKIIKDKVKLNDRKKRTESSRKWLVRQLNDPYVHLAKSKGLRSRAAFKLEEIVKKYNLFQNAKVIVDLGAAPGGWTQVCQTLKPKATIIALDIQEFDPIPGTLQIIGDVTDPLILDQLKTALDDQKVDVVLSDMAASACGIPSVDHDRIMNLLDVVVHFGIEHLNINGHLVGKVLRGGTENNLLSILKKYFKKVTHFKPESSRQESAEMYVVAQSFKGIL
ncbi:MAG: RlmE family RNA methyltransferase [Proteobacteria bacterium]|nr:RlmE family RNA methyltransferase [Pseudomonadota bacterium]